MNIQKRGFLKLRILQVPVQSRLSTNQLLQFHSNAKKPTPKMKMMRMFPLTHYIRLAVSVDMIRRLDFTLNILRRKKVTCIDSDSNYVVRFSDLSMKIIIGVLLDSNKNQSIF